ncbi:hypothetical protein FHR33_006193 [Nonomuraea dietziae]|uniref:Uncharacterized protein n=1 Tax=Nonomuraea dietziae TaxID=65515 RepID=A0A7W5VDY8_9ACTN|nr:hypothetical protein [Nonomuraea dietziae]
MSCENAWQRCRSGKIIPWMSRSEVRTLSGGKHRTRLGAQGVAGMALARRKGGQGWNRQRGKGLGYLRRPSYIPPPLRVGASHALYSAYWRSS